MELVILGTALCAVIVMIIVYMLILFVNEAGDANVVFALILGIVLITFLCAGIPLIFDGIAEQQTIQVESGDMNDK